MRLRSGTIAGGQNTFVFGLHEIGLSNAFTGGHSDTTSFYKIELDAPWTAVRVCIFGKESAASTGWSAIVAGTETAALDTLNNQYAPTVGGVAYNDFSANGWRATNFGGGALAASPDGGNTASVLVSEWLAPQCVPRADGGTRNLLLVGIHHNGASNGTHSIFTNSQNFSWAAGQAFYRHFWFATFSL